MIRPTRLHIAVTTPEERERCTVLGYINVALNDATRFTASTEAPASLREQYHVPDEDSDSSLKAFLGHPWLRELHFVTLNFDFVPCPKT